MTSRFSLAGKNAVVTGGSRGIGAAIAIGLAEAGADVVLTYRERHDEAQAIVHRIEALGRKAHAVPMDVTSRASITHAAGQAQMFGPVSILVNNAGINKPTDFDQISDDDWDMILDANLKGPFIVSQVFLPLMKAAGGGAITHIGSVSGQYGGPRTAHYAASKAGLISLAQVIARFGAQFGVRSNTVAAGLIANVSAYLVPPTPSPVSSSSAGGANLRTVQVTRLRIPLAPATPINVVPSVSSAGISQRQP